MKLSEAKTAYTFDDLMLVPRHSDIKSRKNPDTSTQIGNTKLKIPIISAPMNTVTEEEMSRTMAYLGGSSVLHRYMSPDDQSNKCKELLIHGIMNDQRIFTKHPFYVAIGATGDFLSRACMFYDTFGFTH